MTIEWVQIDIVTGEKTVRVLTPEEEAAYLATIAPPAVSTSPDPKGFYEKAIGAKDNTVPLSLVYQSLARRALDDTQDTSSLVGAMLIYDGALNNNDWSQAYAKDLYQSAYEKLKPFLSLGQISIIDEENVNFRLV